MNGTLDAAALAVTGAGVVVVVLAAGLGRWRDGLALTLDLWLGAGLLRLAIDPTWSRIGAATSIVAVRRLLALGRAASAPQSRRGWRRTGSRGWPG